MSVVCKFYVSNLCKYFYKKYMLINKKGKQNREEIKYENYYFII